MANRRMFSRSVIDSDNFIDMPHSAQLLYFHLGMQADDDGFLDNYKGVMRQLGCNEDNLKLLIVKGFVLPFDNGVIVIRHWKQHNLIKNDRYKPTIYQEQKALLTEQNGVYNISGTILEPEWNQSGTKMEPQVSIGKNRLVEGNKQNIECVSNIRAQARATHTPFVPPTVEEVRAYCIERNNGIDPQRFVDFYTSKGWVVGKSPMKDWKACVRVWERQEKQRSQQPGSTSWLDDLQEVFDDDDK